MKLDRDRLINADPAEVARGATALADIVQDLPQNSRPLAVAAFFQLYLSRLGIEPQDAMTITGNLMARAESLGVRGFSALRAYLAADF